MLSSKIPIKNSSKNFYQQKSYLIIYVLKYFDALNMIEDSFELMVSVRKDTLREGKVERNDRGVNQSRLNDRG